MAGSDTKERRGVLFFGQYAFLGVTGGEICLDLLVREAEKSRR